MAQSGGNGHGDIETVADLLRKRTALLESLADTPKDQRTLRDELGVSRSTVYKSLQELAEADIVIQRNGRYELTGFGRFAWQRHDEYLARLRRLDADHETLPEAFQSAGYETVGVSNNCWITGEFGFDRGFETFRKGWQYLQSDVDTGAIIRAHGMSERIAALKEQLTTGNPAVTLANVIYERYLCGDNGAARTTQWLDEWLVDRQSRGEDRPFFLFCNYIEPHIEYDPPRDYAEQFLSSAEIAEATQLRQDPRAFDVGEYDLSDRECALLRGLYRGELAYVDAKIGALRESLQETGQWENTIFVVLGDHGENIGEYGFFGHQYNLHETVVHVPLILSGGPFVDGGQFEEYVQLLDLVPTLLDATEIPASKLAMQAQGQSFHPDATAPPRQAVYAEHIQPQPSIESLEARFGDLPERVQAFDRSLRSIRTDGTTYIRGSDGSR